MMIHKKTSDALLILLSLIFFCRIDVGYSLLSSSSGSGWTRHNKHNTLSSSPLHQLTAVVDSSSSSTSTIDSDNISDDDRDGSRWGFIPDNTESFSTAFDTTASNNKEKTWAEITNELKDVAAPIISEDGEEEYWVQDEVDEIIDEIHNAFSTLDATMYDTSFLNSEQPKKRSFLDTSRTSFQEQQQTQQDRAQQEQFESDMDDEIAMLVRCNEQPESLLIEEGRAIPPLTEEERNDITQLISINPSNNHMEATEFLRKAITQMFHAHAVPSVKDGVLSMDRACVASWMTKSLKEDPDEKIRGGGIAKVSLHDKRVLVTMSQFSHYGSGRLVEENFHTLYVNCLIGNKQSSSRAISNPRYLEQRSLFRDSVWRDIRAHGILSPTEEEHLLLTNEVLEHTNEVLELTSLSSNTATSTTINEENSFDECEILWGEKDTTQTKRRSPSASPTSRSSHMSVEMANDDKTPLRIRDGDFVFIDEESCIGCTVCSTMATSSFQMVEDSGRARAYFQRTGKDVDQAVDACPVNCMHRVSYDELRQLETVRDEGDGRTDHKFLGHRRGHIPLHVAGMDSDVNRRPSWYHTSKETCVSKGCKSGCFDCPSYSTPGTNPIFVEKDTQAIHIRALQLIENGEADSFRTFVEL
eukprot:CAMPEP_0170837918 /NCGR_PEP_ID=MMETSP0734-20130129/3059_1 /TAXON_ID=186038 /ORGANISM="Fragilariopsis kerguelensis, Strain L26-C5" /LENGTH=640 /DNA_ID=CAMNT_0011205209 /DNA_START=120 /DNA_END=2042 /DNA_ORIENTATION=+